MHVPERCMKCNAFFDLWYDLHEKEEGSAYVDFDKPLCWNCRKMWLGKRRTSLQKGNEIEIELEFD